MFLDSKERQALLARPGRTIQEAFALSVAALVEVTTAVATLVPEWLRKLVVQQAVVARSEIVDPVLRAVPPPEPGVYPAATILAWTAFSVASEG